MARKFTHEEYLQELKNKGITWCYPLEEYNGTRKAILHRCTMCNTDYIVMPKYVLRGIKHKQCMIEINAEKKRCGIDEFKKKLHEARGDEISYISGEYKNCNSSKLLFSHNKGKYHEFYSTPSHVLERDECPVCRGWQIYVGFNDIGTTHPNIANLMKNENDRYSHTAYDTDTVDFVCQICGTIKRNKISNVTSKGFSCDVCGDGISYPNKFIYNIMLQLESKNIIQKLKRECKFDWCVFDFNGETRFGIYDIVFELDNIKYIIEMDGGFGHGNSETDISIDDTIYIDNKKDELAIENGYIMIRIDCNYGCDLTDRYTYIKNNIMNSKLSKIIDLSVVDFDLANKESQKSLVLLVCELYKKEKSIGKISSKLCISRGTVTKYLNIGRECGMSDYDKTTVLKKSVGRKVMCNETREKFDSIVDAANKYVIRRTTIWSNCNNRSKTGGVYNGKKITWKYIDNK